MFTKDTRTFQEKLTLGQEKENMLIDILNLSGFKARSYNDKEVTDIDVELVDDNILIDSKYMGTPFYSSYKYAGIQPADCLTISKKYVNIYDQKEKERGKEVWVACFVDYNNYNVYELVFFKNSYLKDLVDNSNDSNYKLHFNRNQGFSLNFFLNYLKMQRKFK